jgi:hypothetical protein
MKFLKNVRILLSEKKFLFLFVLLSLLIFIVLGISMEIIVIIWPNFFFFTTGMLAFSGFQYLFFGLLFLISIPILTSLALTMNVYRFLELKSSVRTETSTSFLGIISGIFMAGCPQCVPLLLFTLGITVTTWLAFFSKFGILFWLATIAISAFSLYSTSSKFGEECKKCKI